MNPVVQQLIKEGHLTVKQAQRIQERVDRFVKQAAKDPELMSAAMDKLGADPASFLGRMGTIAKDYLPLAAVAGLTSVGTAAATGALSHGYSALKDAVMRNHGYKAMLATHGEDLLAEVPPAESQRLYNTLYRLNPEFAGDPTVAANFIRTTHEQERLDLNQVKALVDARRSSSDTGTAAGINRMILEGMRNLPQIQPRGGQGGVSRDQVQDALRTVMQERFSREDPAARAQRMQNAELANKL